MALAHVIVTLAVGFFVQLSASQASTVCNPLKGTCPSDKGLDASIYSIDFTKAKSTPENWTVANYENITYGTNGAEFKINKRHDAPSMWTDFKLWFGRIEVVAQGAPGLGIISSMVLLSDDLDEIDWEMKGSGGKAIGTNYWGKGILDYTNNVYVGVSAPNSAFHTYSLDWSPSSLVWEIDGVTVRNVTAAQAGDKYPQSPMKLCLSVWDGGDPSNPEGVIQWAGGVTPFPPPKSYTMFVKSAKITNFNSAAAYEYTDRSGKASSIKMIKDAPAIHSSSTSSATALHSRSVQPSVTSSFKIMAEGKASTSTTLTSSASSPSKSSSSIRSLPGPITSTQSKIPSKSLSLSSSGFQSHSSHLTDFSTLSATSNSIRSAILGVSDKDSASYVTTSSKMSTTLPPNSTVKVIYTSLTIFSQISVTTTIGKTSQRMVSITSFVNSTSTATICPVCSSRTTEYSTANHVHQFSADYQSVSSTVPITSSTKSTSTSIFLSSMTSATTSAPQSPKHEDPMSSQSSASAAAKISSAAPPMAPVLLAAVKPASSKSNVAAITGKQSASTTATSGTSTTTFLLTSTSMRIHSLLLWSTNGTSTVLPSTGIASGSTVSTSAVSSSSTTSTWTPSSTTSSIIFTAGAYVLKPWALWTSCFLTIFGALFAH